MTQDQQQFFLAMRDAYEEAQKQDTNLTDILKLIEEKVGFIVAPNQ
ncbi:hypothetical protein [Pseudobacillus wudalianchiensis]|nr:hypothetical protein [Bacillus wudalianchiensis]